MKRIWFYSIKTEDILILHIKGGGSYQWKKEAYANFKKYINFLHATGNHLTKELPLPSTRYLLPLSWERKWTCREKMEMGSGTIFSQQHWDQGTSFLPLAALWRYTEALGKKPSASSNQWLGSTFKCNSFRNRLCSYDHIYTCKTDILMFEMSEETCVFTEAFLKMWAQLCSRFCLEDDTLRDRQGKPCS